MKILIVHRYYWPDTAPAATIFRSIARRWVEDGHEVTAFSTQPTYSGDIERQPKVEPLDGSRVIRAGLFPESKTNYAARALNYGVFFTKAFAHAVRGKYDVIVALTVPPILPAFVLRHAARLSGAALVYQCMDIFPELGVASGTTASGKVTKFLRWVDTGNVKGAHRTVVLSSDMRQLMLDRGASADSVAVINNLDIEEFTAPANDATIIDRPDESIQVLFAGNIGRFQGLGAVIDAARSVQHDSRIRFDFLGSGIAEDSLREQAGDLLGSSVFFHGRVSATEAAAAARQADIVLITLASGVIRAAYPSKTVTYLRAGTPIVAMVEPDSELGEMIADDQLGAVVAPGDSAGLAAAVATLADADREPYRQRCRATYERRFDRSVILDQWSELLSSVTAKR